MPAAVLLVLAGILLLIIRILHLASKAAPPVLCFTNSLFNRTVLEKCPLLYDYYVPPLLWGKSGHLQTLTYGKMGRINSPNLSHKRHSVVMKDGATVTFDIFETATPHPSGSDYTLMICPGLASSSENLYIRTCVHYAQTRGYRVAVLNHLGALKNVPLTAPRIFTYGGTEEYGTMVDSCLSLYPDTRAIAVGFSMGANIVLKYIGEDPSRSNKLLCAMSCCQGYDMKEAVPFMMSWEHASRIYIYAMTLNIQKVYRNHYQSLFGADTQTKTGRVYNEDIVFGATNLPAIDREYSAPRAGFESMEKYYDWCSCSHYLDGIKIPVFILNSLDDPIVRNELHRIPKEFALKRDNVIFATTKHGGHLGYFESRGLFVPETLTWLDKIVVEYADAVVSTVNQKPPHQMEEVSM